jgi:hypothetical protein
MSLGSLSLYLPTSPSKSLSLSLAYPQPAPDEPADRQQRRMRPPVDGQGSVCLGAELHDGGGGRGGRRPRGRRRR